MWGPNFLVTWASRLSSLPAALFLALIAALWGAVVWHRSEIKKGNRGVQAWQIFAVGTAGAWLLATVAIGALLWLVVSNNGIAVASSAGSEDAGPLQWYYNLELEGGNGLPIYSLRFRGQNISQKEVLLKSASIRSAIKGAEIPLAVC
jgi:hypothetical protein